MIARILRLPVMGEASGHHAALSKKNGLTRQHQDVQGSNGFR
ncbi:hypothetical protein [Pantoea stewartii]